MGILQSLTKNTNKLVRKYIRTRESKHINSKYWKRQWFSWKICNIILNTQNVKNFFLNEKKSMCEILHEVIGKKNETHYKCGVKKKKFLWKMRICWSFFVIYYNSSVKCHWRCNEFELHTVHISNICRWAYRITRKIHIDYMQNI